ncbi:dihydrolipoamide acetyltransferase component of pyruvate dehydrogenase complex [Persicobacter psychrovividus]|uniref:Acetyltransferase component of pyruvate dehydrogenase complex n=2 Tax=Persicobacter psychrovividus TaxID=387638 RepID=A0ABM7VE67_9BACT|nr:dihydrolipoamide acetyltransferase component of pyruvate dehydrogenase complex [Persicobacter psychrovividus]
MPKMSDTMTEGTIATWLKKVGDQVESGDILAEVETDKATMELESYEEGTLLYIGVEEKSSVPIDGVIAIIGEEGEDITSLKAEISNGGASESAPAPKEEEAAAPAPAAEAVDTSDIAAEIIRMPKMSDTMTEGVIATWVKSVGDEVETGDILAEVETDKATMELESYSDGKLLYIAVEAGGAVPIDGIIAIIGESDADWKKLLAADSSQGSAPKAEAPKEEAPKTENTTAAASAPAPAVNTTANGGRIKASPLAKKIAADKGIDLTQVQGTGDNGRIIKRDIENFTPQAAPAPQASAPASAPASATAAAPVELPQVVGEESFEEVPNSKMRNIIASRLTESKQTAPHYYLTMDIDMDSAIKARKQINEVSPVKVSFNDMVVKATALALRQNLKVNAAWYGDKIRYNKHVHIGVAVAIEDGLVVPTVKFADNKSLSHLGAEVKELATKAKNRKLGPAEMEGNTFTISNLGMFGIESFTSIVNPPSACILSVGGIKAVPVVKNGAVVPGNVMKVTLACDHRVVDGALGAAFLKTFKELLEEPVRMLI